MDNPLQCSIKNEDGSKTDVTIFCSNDYLGLSSSDLAKQAQIETIMLAGVGSGGTRNIGGSSIYHKNLERTIAKFHNKEKALIFSSCFTANQGVLNAIKKIFPEIVYLSDSKNHASLIEGIRNSGARKMIFQHNDINQLEEQLKKLQSEEKQKSIKIPKCIVFESVYSMCGTKGKILEILKLAKQYNALTLIDEVHAIGMYGSNGSGICNEMGVEDQVDIITGTMSKGIGTYGGYVAGNELLIDCIRSFSQNFIFTSSIPPGICRAADVNIQYIMSEEGEQRRIQLHNNADKIKKCLQENQIEFLPTESHIIPVFVGDSTKVKEASNMLMNDYGIYIQPINYPTVKKGEEVLRISPCSMHTDEMIQQLVFGLKQTFQRLSIMEHGEKDQSNNFFANYLENKQLKLKSV